MPGFSNLLRSIQSEPLAWQSYYESDNIHTEKLFQPFDSTLSQWRKLILLKTLRQEKIVFGITRLISTYLGPRFVEMPQVDLKSVYADSTNRTPVIFVLSSGADPQAMFDKFAKDTGHGDRIFSLSLGQGQGPKAAQMIQRAQTNGDWVFLQNCHLAVSWMPDLERIVEELSDKLDVHPGFRLWLTSMPSLKANIKGSLKEMDEKLYESSTKPREWKKLFFGLVFFHALTQERRKFGSLGFNIPYEWNNSDLDASIKSLKLYLEEQAQVPWEALRYTIGVIHFGGRVTDFLDLHCVQSILKNFFTSTIFDDDYAFTMDKKYYAPKVGTLEEVKQYVSQLPAFEEPEVFGLHQNANITFQRKETKQLLDTIISVQPRATGSGGDSGAKSDDDVVLDMVADFLQRLPKLLDTSIAHETTFARISDGTMNTLGTFLQQEVAQFNRLLKVMERTLIELRRAIQGFVVMSADLERMYNAFLYQKVPVGWENVAYPSLKSLNSWFDDLCSRVQFMRCWITEGPPTSFFISYFFFPQGFLTSVLQMHARRFKIPIDTLRFKTHVLSSEEEATMNERGSPDIGVYVSGLYMEGARWDVTLQCVAESEKGTLFTKMPSIWLEPKTIQEYDDEQMPHLYKCPMYKTALRAGALSTTGLSTNFVMSAGLQAGTMSPDTWTQRGVAMLLSLPD